MVLCKHGTKIRGYEEQEVSSNITCIANLSIGVPRDGPSGYFVSICVYTIPTIWVYYISLSTFLHIGFYEIRLWRVLSVILEI